MPKGVKITELEVGTGRVAERGLLATVNLRRSLNKGEEPWTSAFTKPASFQASEFRPAR